MSALDGILVADFTRVLAGPYATMLLADLGADVIKVERPEVGDDTRDWGPPYDADGVATYYLAVNRNKRSVILDLTDPAGLAAATELARRADVVVENFKPGTMARLGLDYSRVAAVNPGVVYCSISGFGAGAGAELVGYDLLVQAVGGLMSVTGPAPGQPTKAGVAVVDVTTGLHATIAILAALHHRQRTGVGQQVSVNLLSSLLSALVNQSAGYVSAGVVPGILGNRHPSVVPYEVVPTADQPMVIAVGTDRQFQALTRALDAPDLAAAPEFAGNADRVRHRAELLTLITARTARLASAELVTRLRAVGVPCGPINDLAGAFTLAEQLGLDPVVEIHHPTGKAARQVANPLGLATTPPRYDRPPPRLGEHTAEVLAWLRTPRPETPR